MRLKALLIGIFTYRIFDMFVCESECVCVCVCVCVSDCVGGWVHVCERVCLASVIIKRPALPPCAGDGRCRNPRYYYISVLPSWQ